MTEKRWFKTSDGRLIYRSVPLPQTAKSDFPCPRLNLDTIEPTISMADGKEYTSKAALRATYRADGNPDGVNYVEVGNETLTNYTPPKRDPQKVLETIERAEADIIAGKAPEIGTIDTSTIDQLRQV